MSYTDFLVKSEVFGDDLPALDLTASDFALENLQAPVPPAYKEPDSYNSDGSSYASSVYDGYENYSQYSPAGYEPGYESYETASSYASSTASSPNGYYSSPPPAPGVYYEHQMFFPPSFDFQPQLWNHGLQQYIQTTQKTVPVQKIELSTVGKAESSLKNRRRASRSKCPCIKCCHARANAIPSPPSHACMISGCNKTYTRPAHLKAHLRSHENDRHPKCEICSKTLIKTDLFISHMFEHGKAMKL